MSDLGVIHRGRFSASTSTVAALTVVVVVLGFMGLMAWGMLNQESRTGRSGITRTGKPAPDFTLGVLGSSAELALSDYAGTPIVLNVWASWCPPCRVELPLLEKGWEEYGEAGVQFIGLDIQDTESAALSTVRQFGLTYPNVRDVAGRTAVEYGVTGLPVTFFIDRNGLVVRRAVGALTSGLLAVAVEELIADEAPTGGADVVNPDGFYDFGGS